MKIAITKSENSVDIGTVIFLEITDSSYAIGFPFTTFFFNTLYNKKSYNGRMRIYSDNRLEHEIEIYIEETTVKLFGIKINDVKKLVDEPPIDLEFIKDNMKLLQLSQNDVGDLLNIDKGTISSILAGYKELTKWHKAAFYYLFKSMR